MRQTAEPTVEEILESIKQVIARDNRAEAAAERQRRETAGVIEPAGASTDIDEADVLDLAQTGELIEGEGNADQQSEDEGGGDESPDNSNEPLVNAIARASMRESLAALNMLAEPGAPPQIVRSGETSLEGLVRELLRPALAEWLDKNLPPLVERMVAAEIKRIVGKKT